MIGEVLFRLNEELGKYFLYRALRFLIRKNKEGLRSYLWNNTKTFALCKEYMKEREFSLLAMDRV